MELQLFKYLTKNNKQEISNEMLIAATGTKRVTDLKNNLFSKAMEVITSEKLITNRNIFNDYDISVFQLKKKLLAFKVSSRSQNQGKTETLNVWLDNIIEKAKELESYDTLVEALTAKKYFKGIRMGLKEFEKLNDELEFYDYCCKAVFRSTDNYYRLILNNDFVKTFSNHAADKHIEDSIAQMEQDVKKTKSEQVYYYLYIMRFAAAERKKNYSKAIDYCTQLIARLSKSKVIYRNERMGFAYTNLSQYRTFNGDYLGAIKDAKKSQKYYLENSFNYAISKEQEFHANFYYGSYTDAKKCLIELLEHPTIDTGQFRKSKFIYYQACTFFAERQFSGALRLLNEALEIEKDKTRRNVSIRILIIMIFLELNKIDQASIAVEALRKHVGRNKKEDQLSPRDIDIVKLLRELEKEGFEFKKRNPSASQLLKKLSEKNNESSWEHYNSELIKFHEWVQQKK